MLSRKLLLSLLALTISLLSVNAIAANTANEASFSTAQKAEIGTIIHDYLLKNPSILVEMSQKLQAEQQAKEQARVMKIIPSVAPELFNDRNDPILGNAKGTVTIAEFFDYRCPHCQAMSAVLDNLLKKHANVRIVLKPVSYTHLTLPTTMLV